MSDNESRTPDKEEQIEQERLYTGQHINSSSTTATSGSAADASRTDQVTVAVDAVKKALAVCKDPKGIWRTLKNEEWTVESLYRNFLIPLVLIGGACTLIGTALSESIVGAVLGTLIGIAAFLAIPFVAAIVVEKCAAVFEGNVSLDDSLKFVAFTYSPVFLAQFLGFIPLGIIVALISFVASLYSIYLFWEGVVPMTGVPQSKKAPFVVMVVAILVVISIVLAIIQSFFFAL